MTRESKITILWLVLFFPVGLYYMYKRSAWSTKTKHSITGLFVLLVIGCAYIGVTAAPVVTVSNIKPSTRVTTKASTYTLKGDVYPYSSALTVNGKKVSNNQGKFTYAVPLKEGDNTVTVQAKAHDKITATSYKVHRSTRTELAQQAAIQKQLADKTVANKTAEAEKQAATKAAADKVAADKSQTVAVKNQQAAADKAATTAQAKQAADAKAAAAAQANAQATAAANKPKPTITQLWTALDQSLKTRKGMDIHWSEQTKIAELSYSNKTFFNEKDVVGTSYRQFVQWGKKVANVPGVETIETHVKTEFTDSYGKKAMSDAVSIDMQVSDFKLFNWDNLKGQPIHNQLRSTELGSMYIHPAISKKVDLNKVKLLY